MKLTFKDIEEKGLLLYKYIRGSQVYGTNIETSDEDYGGIFIAPNTQLLDLGFDYQNEISDDKHDTCWWEVGKFMRLLLSSNPTVLEALFVPDEFVLFEHPIITELKKHRDMFLTKACFKPFGGYAVSQIQKAQGQNKKIHWDVAQMVRKTPLDYCYTFDDKQGSVNIQKWLDERGLEQRNCGLVNIPNMPDMYGVYYDYGQHMKLNGIDKEYFCDEKNIDEPFIKYMFNNFIPDWCKQDFGFGYLMGELYEKIKTPIGKHCGIISPDGDSNEIRYSETKKGDRPICFMSYNDNGYRQHCKKYKEYEEWKQNRNKARYENNLVGKEMENVSRFYDSKNMCHCFRLLNMCIEVARGEGLNLNRRGIDAEFLLDVRNRVYTYDELMEKLLKLKENMDNEIENSQIPDEINCEVVNSMLLNIRTEFWNMYNLKK